MKACMVSSMDRWAHIEGRDIKCQATMALSSVWAVERRDGAREGDRAIDLAEAG